MKLFIITFVSVLSFTALAEARAFAAWGIASSHPGSHSYSDVKFVEFGSAGEVGKLAYTAGVGGWHDGTGYVGGSGIKSPTVNTDHFHMEGGELQEPVRDSLFFETLLGVEPKSDHFYLSYKLGPAIITNTDALLGSNIQCSHEIGFGMRDVREVRVGIVIKHYSNAGIIKPNKGRDFLGVRIEF